MVRTSTAGGRPARPSSSPPGSKTRSPSWSRAAGPIARPRSPSTAPSPITTGLDRLSQGEAAVSDASWVHSAQGSDFPIQNLPLGIFSEAKGRRRPGVAIGDYVLDLAAIADLLDEDWRGDLSQPVLNAWLARG